MKKETYILHKKRHVKCNICYFCETRPTFPSSHLMANLVYTHDLHDLLNLAAS